MTTIRKLSEVKGSVFDLPKSQALSDDDCNVLLVSSRTLYFIQTFATGEVDFLARYASSFLDGAKFILANTSTDLDQINDIQNRYEIEVQPVTADLIAELQNITLAIQQIAGADCGSCGSELDPDAAPAPTIGPGEEFETLNEYEVYKCQATNWLLDALIDIFTKLDVYNLVFWTTATVGTASALVTAILATTLLVGILAIVAGAVVAMVVSLIAGASIDLENIKDILIANRDDLACFLFSGEDAETAKTNFLDELTTLGLNIAERGLISIILAFQVMNNLFELNPDIVGHPVTSSCDACQGSCDLFFTTFSDKSNRGSGSLVKDGAQRTLTSVEHPTNNKYYISVNVSELPTNQTLFSTCSPMNPLCSGTNDENWDFKPVSVSGYTHFGSSGTRCTSGVHLEIWSPSLPAFGVTYQVSWFEYISTTPFTLDCEFTQRP